MFCTYCLGAGELGGDVEVDEILSHKDIRHAIAIVSDLHNKAVYTHSLGKEAVGTGAP